MSGIAKFILVDDDSINNMICRITIQKTLVDVGISAFTEPEKALEFIQNEYREVLNPTIIILDINMPIMTGWEFLEKYQCFEDVIKKQINIYIVSSSVDQRDKDKARENLHVTGFLSKPLNAEKILEMYNEALGI